MTDPNGFDDLLECEFDEFDDLSECEFDEDIVFAGMREGVDEEMGKLH